MKKYFFYPGACSGYKALPKYTMFHDLYVLLKQQDVLEVHEFLDFDHPITSNIFPLEKANQPVLNILQDIGQEKYILPWRKKIKNTFRIYY